MTEISKSQIDKLGHRLRASAEPSESDIGELNTVLEGHQRTLIVAGAAVEHLVPDLRIVAVRLKTARSTIEKLKRSPTMRLSEMQDLAGVRVVVGGGRIAQDRVVASLNERFEGARIVDRRESPNTAIALSM